MENEVKKKKSGKLLIVASAVVLCLGIGIYSWIISKSYETTDNAQLDCNIIPVRSIVNAYIKSINFKDNEVVKKGQVLIVFDTIEISAKLRGAEAALHIAQSKLLAAKNKANASIDNTVAGNIATESNEQSIVSAKANLEKTQRAYDRTKALFTIKAATQEQFEIAESNLTIAKADYTKAVNAKMSSTSTTSGLKSLAKSDDNQINLAVSQVEQCRVDVILAKKQLEYAIVHAPCDGIVSKRAVQEGQYISSGQNLCSVVDNQNLWVSANIKETQLANVKIGQSVLIKIDAYPDLEYKGKIESFSGATGAKYSLLPPDNATGNFIKITQRIPIKISVQNMHNDKTHELFPGMSAFVKIYSE